MRFTPQEWRGSDCTFTQTVQNIGLVFIRCQYIIVTLFRSMITTCEL